MHSLHSEESQYTGRKIPYLIGYQDSLYIASVNEVGYFKLLFFKYEPVQMKLLDFFPPNYEVKIVSSIVGKSITLRNVFDR